MKQKKINLKEFTQQRSIPVIAVNIVIGLMLIITLDTVLLLSAQNILDRDLMKALNDTKDVAESLEECAEQGIDVAETVDAMNEEYVRANEGEEEYLLYDTGTGKFLVPASGQGRFEVFTLKTGLHRYTLAVSSTAELYGAEILNVKGNQLSLNLLQLMRMTFENWKNSAEEIDNSILLRMDGYSGAEIGDGSGLILFARKNFRIYGYDVRYFMLFSILNGFLMLSILAVVIFSVFKTLRSGRHMILALYHDENSNGYNWLFFRSRGEQLLKNREKDYAVVSLKNNKVATCRACYGGDAGDELLKKTCEVMEKQTDRWEIVSHYADGTFALLLRYKDPEALKTRVQRFTQEIFDISSRLNGYVHAGICMIGEIRDADDEEWSVELEHYYHHAEMACESIRSKDDAGIRVFDDGIYDAHMWERKIETHMEEALKNEEFVVWLQPKYDPRTSELKGAEALIRWISPTDGFISPGRFIPYFEEIGFIMKIDDYMLKKVAQLQARWLREGYSTVPVSVNISRAHFALEDLAEHITAIIDAEEVPHELIELELTESAFFDDKSSLIATVRRLQERGFQVSMDDFGSGYSSLNSLKDLPLDVLKLDAEFFRGENEEKRGAKIVEEAVRLGKALQMEIVAEGVETKSQVDFLADIGCDMIQGYYFDKPLPVHEFETRMKRQPKD